MYSQELSGLNYDGQYASNNIGAPYLTKTLNQADNNVQDRWIYTTSLPMADRINLFNLKAKYFDETFNNPGGAVNRIKVSFEPTSNKFHYDNTVVIICDKGSLNSLKSGQLISFQNPTLSKDINLTGGILNNFGNNAITGTTSTGSTNIKIYYAKPDGTGNIVTPVQYAVNITATTTNNFHKFPIDFEYFQVITGMTYSDFSGKCITNEIGFKSLNQRYISNTTLIAQDYNPKPSGFINYPDNVVLRPIEYIKDYDKLCVLILNRGVDPYTPKVPISYGLGRLFGYNDENQISVNGYYHMNIPIQGSFKNISHSSIDLSNSNIGTDTYTGQKLYFNSFSYKPQINTITGPITSYSAGTSYVYTGVLNSGFSGFNSNLISYYSSLDNRSLNTVSVNCGGVPVSNIKPILDNQVVNTNNTYGLGVSDLNHYTWKIYEFTIPNIPFVTNACEGSKFNFMGTIPNPYSIFTPPYQYSSNTIDNQGYYYKEIVEGGSVMYTNLKTYFPYEYIDFPVNKCEQALPTTKYDVTDQDGNYSITSNYYSPIYNTTGNTLAFSLGSLNPVDFPNGGYQTVMRGDRLPTSTNVEEYCCNGMVLQKNNNFKIFLIPDDGVLSVSSSQGSTGSAGSGDFDYMVTQDLSGSTNISRIFDTFTCNGSVNLECYGCQRVGPNGSITISGRSCQEYLGETIFEFGCYRFVTTIFLSLLKDWELMFEWIARNMVMLGACRNVFSHRFVHNWVNGTVYAFPIKTEVVAYTSPTSNPPNSPISSYCGNLVHYDSKTRNYYYRSTKYDVTNKVFKKYSDSNIGFPTTMMDLGPRAEFLQELVMSDEYDGYVVNRLDSSSFGTVDDILNLFIVSRFIDNTFLKTLLGSLNILAYFSNSRPSNGVRGTKLQIDADYAQLISINSELGVAPFSSSNYPDNPLPGEQNPIFFDCNNVMGIFFSSDTQVRDYITPKRTIINPSATTVSSCAFNNFPVFSQRVPFSQWIVNGTGNDTIFGRQFNNWDFEVDNSVFSHQYQSLDRLDQSSRYFRTNGSVQTQYQKGYIYAVKSSTTSNSVVITAENQYWDNNNPDQEKVTVGAPFHFYFGLRRGASSFDRFKTKWINTNNITN